MKKDNTKISLSHIYILEILRFLGESDNEN